MMAAIDVGLLPVGEGDRLVGMITDRDIAVRAVGEGKGPATLVEQVMTQDVKYCYEDEDTGHIARNMAEQQVRRLPVLSHDKRLVGMITDRDIAVRGVAAGMGPNAKVGDVMNSEVKYCFDDQEVDEVLRNMGDLQVRRLPVLNRDKRLVGIVSLGDLARKDDPATIGQTVTRVSTPGGKHDQTSAH